MHGLLPLLVRLCSSLAHRCFVRKLHLAALGAAQLPLGGHLRLQPDTGVALQRDLGTQPCQGIIQSRDVRGRGHCCRSEASRRGGRSCWRSLWRQ